MTTITIERAVLLRALEALRPATAPNGAKRDAAFEELRAALAAPATAPEKTVKEIMEFARHYAANTFSSATLEDKIRRSLAASATAPEPENDCVLNHICNGRLVHLPDGEQCDRCGSVRP